MFEIRRGTGFLGGRGLSVMAFSTALVALAACADGGTGPANAEETLLLSVVPQGGATGVDPSAPVVVEFSHAMMAGMEQYADVHEGGVEGPLVAGSFTWNPEHTRLTFTPDAPLKHQTQYVLHLGGGMVDENGQHINYEQHGTTMGGQWMTQQMHQGGQHGYGMGQGGMGGMGGGSGMGEGWIHPGNGSYGMIFVFTTA